MREIEIKAVIRDKDSLIAALEKEGAKFIGKKRQLDTIFLPYGKSYDDLKDVNILRIRKESGDKEAITFNMKRHVSNELDCIEHETVINSPDSMAKIINELGYYEAISVDKTRVSGSVDKYNFNIDDVVGLGSFLELELLVDDSDEYDAIEIQNRMKLYLANISVKSDDVIIFSYDTELYKRTNS